MSDLRSEPELDVPELVEREDGMLEWLVNGERHRTDGPALIEPGNHRSWWYRGDLHREDGPAVVHPDGTQEWFHRGQPHREDGPAVTGPGCRRWYLYGRSLSEAEFLYFRVLDPDQRPIALGLLAAGTNTADAFSMARLVPM